jgi:hypothetical protein
LPSSIKGAAHEHPALSVGILDTESSRSSVDFPVTGEITKSRYHQLRLTFISKLMRGGLRRTGKILKYMMEILEPGGVAGLQ